MAHILGALVARATPGEACDAMRGQGSRVAFLHAKSPGGALIELCREKPVDPEREIR